MEIRNLVYFLQLYDDNNYSLASSKLYITQQALSKSIHNMEIELGTSLFVKKTHSIEPTDIAKEIEPICREIVLNYRTGLNKIEKIVKYGTYPIRIAVSIQTADTLSFTLFRDFLVLHPEINIEKIAVFDLMAEEKLSLGDVDLAFTVNSPLPIDNYHVEIIRHIQLCIMVTNHHFLAEKETILIKDLNHLDLYCAGEGFKTYELLKKKAKENNVFPNFIPTSGYLYDTYRNIFEGNGAVIGLYGSNLGPEFNDIKMIPFEDKDMTWNICLSWKKNHNLSKEELTFINYVLTFKQ